MLSSKSCASLFFEILCVFLKMFDEGEGVRSFGAFSVNQELKRPHK